MDTPTHQHTDIRTSKARGRSKAASHTSKPLEGHPGQAESPPPHSTYRVSQKASSRGWLQRGRPRATLSEDTTLPLPSLLIPPPV